MHLSGILFSLPTWFAPGLMAMGSGVDRRPRRFWCATSKACWLLFMLLSFVCGIQYGLDSIPAAWRDAVLANRSMYNRGSLRRHLPRGRRPLALAGLLAGGALIALLVTRSSAAWLSVMTHL